MQEIAANISFAPIGLLNMFNSGGAVEQFEVQPTSDSKAEIFAGEATSEISGSLSEKRSPTAKIILKVRGCGPFGAYSSQRPLKCSVDGAETDFTYEATTGLVAIDIPVPKEEMHRWTIGIDV